MLAIDLLLWFGVFRKNPINIDSYYSSVFIRHNLLVRLWATYYLLEQCLKMKENKPEPGKLLKNTIKISKINYIFQIWQIYNGLQGGINALEYV